MKEGGCLDEFRAAMKKCRSDAVEGLHSSSDCVLADEACVRATVTLRECLGRNEPWFEDQIARMDSGLDEDLEPSPEQVMQESLRDFRWWTGMRRN